MMRIIPRRNPDEDERHIDVEADPPWRVVLTMSMQTLSDGTAWTFRLRIPEARELAAALRSEAEEAERGAQT